MTATLCLVDGHAQFHRAYHAIRTRMTSPVTGEPTQLVYGFTGALLKLLRDDRPEYLAVAIDVSGDRESFRSAIYPEYKAHREAPPDDFAPQVDRCLEVLDALGIPVIGEAGVEADDVIATLVRRVRRERPDLRIRIVSRDKDLAQLLDPGVELYDVHADKLLTPADVFGVEGVEARHVPEILALMGDTVDNVPGVRGIGPKTAAQLILAYGTAEALYEHLDEIKGKRRENLEAGRDLVPLARRLVVLDDAVPVPFDLEAARVDLARTRVEDLVELFRVLNFRQHRDTVVALAGRGRPESSSAAETEAPREGGAETAARPAARRRGAEALEGGLFGHLVADEPGAAPAVTGDYRLVATTGELEALVARVRAAGRCAVDTETDDVRPMRARLCGVSIAVAPGEGFYVPVRSPEPESHLDEATALAGLRGVLEDPAIAKIGQNLKFDLLVLRRHGVRVRGPLFDTMIASYVADATRSSHKLDVLALVHLDHVCIPIEDLIGRGAKQRTFDTVPLALAVPYAAEDADVTLRLRDVLAGIIERDGLEELFERTEMPLVEVLEELEWNGIRVDPEELERQRQALQGRIDALRAEIAAVAPHPFNPDSPKQLGVALFGPPDGDPPGLGLKVVKRLKTGPSTDQEVLERLAEDPLVDSPLPRLVLEHRQLAKLVGTYLVNLVECIHPETGRVHASFNQSVAATGRLSSSDPNLQNIPIRTEIGREIRRAFVAEEGNVLVAADYSQIELRLLAHLAEDPALIEAFREGRDIHAAVAAETFGVAESEVTDEQRTTAKMINFGIVYGITAFGLARRLGGGMSNTEAQRVIDEYKARYRRIDEFLEACIDQAKETGAVTTVLGRRRRIPQIESANPRQRALGERMAINTVVQGSAADLIKIAMIDLHRILPERFPEARMLLQIHDELVLECPRADAEPLAAFVAERMAAAMTLRVPLEVKTAWSRSWIDA